MISATSKPLKLKLAGHILYGETRLRTEGFCSARLRSRDIRDIIRSEMANSRFSAINFISPQ